VRATARKLLKKYPRSIPKPLDTAVEKASAYASEMGRHVSEGRTPKLKEVELIVGNCSDSRDIFEQLKNDPLYSM
jgi:hypothetical protein